MKFFCYLVFKDDALSLPEMLSQNSLNRRTYFAFISKLLTGFFLSISGMVKKPRIRFQNLMGIVDVTTAATTIINSMRRRAAIVFIPDLFYYISNFVRMLPAKVQLLLTDFFDTGIDACED